MDSFSFKRGNAFFSSDSPARLWRITFEDEGPAGYLYACDRAKDLPEDSIMDSMLIYTNASQGGTNASQGGTDASQDGTNATQDGTNGSSADDREYLGTVQWSRDGLQAVLYLDGSAQAFVDFALRRSFCRSNFPNFMDQGAAWKTDSHAWDEAAIARFEAEMYA